VELPLIVVIDLQSTDNANIILQTLNARGTLLLASDLIKNSFLRGAEGVRPKKRCWKGATAGWDETSIRERGHRLAMLATEVWPRPAPALNPEVPSRSASAPGYAEDDPRRPCRLV